MTCAAALLVVSCSGDSSGSTSTSQAIPTSVPTTPEGSSTSSTIAGATTTSAPISTSTSELSGAATTTVAPSTTEPTVPEGNWAPEPLIVASFGALGWWDGDSWVQVEADTQLPISGGEEYQIARFDIRATTVGGEQTLLCEPLELPGVELDDPELLGEWPGPYGVAISAPWRLTPRPIEEFTDPGVYSAAARELLDQRGLDVAAPVIKQLIRADLDDDGTNEIIVVAEDIQGAYQPPTVGDYSIVFVRKVVDDQVQTAVLGESIIDDRDTDLNLGFAVGAVADLDGDGTMEVVVSTAYYEGLGVEVWQYFNDDLGMIPTVRAGCGA